jgi:hypothetical protein
LELNYKCTLCETIFPTRQAWHVHSLKCTAKHAQKASYKILKVTLFDSLNLSDLDSKEITLVNRFQINVRDWIYRFLCMRDGEHCVNCGAGPTNTQPLEIDHADCNPVNNAPANLHLLCKPCNLTLRQVGPKEHARLVSKYSANNECVCVCANGNPSTEISKAVIGYESGSTEMRANSYYEVTFRRWILEQVGKVPMIPKQDAIYSGAEIVGCSPATIERYLKKLTSSAGILQVIANKGQSFITKRNMEAL